MIFISVAAVLLPDRVGYHTRDAEAEFFVKSTRSAVAFDEVKLDDLDALALLCRRDHFTEESRTYSEIPIFFKYCDRNDGAMSNFHTRTKADLTVTRDLAVDKAGYGERVSRFTKAFDPFFFLFDRHAFPFLGGTKKKLGLSAGLFYVSEHPRRIGYFGCFQYGGFAVFEGDFFLLEYHFMSFLYYL